MRIRFVSLLTSLLCVASAGAALAQAPVSPSVLDAVGRGSVRVLIRLQTPTVPEGQLGSPSAIAEQRRGIASAQDRVRTALGDESSIRRFRSVPWMAASVTSSQLAMLRRHASVAAIYRDELMRPALAESVPFIGAPVFWDVGYAGTGWTVAVLDTGVDSNHPMLKGRVVHEACFSTNSVEDSATSLCAGGAPTGSGSGSAPPCPLSIAGCNHGTAMAGVIGGRGTSFSGVAPDVRLASLQVYSRVDDDELCHGAAPCALSYTSDQIAALEHVIEMAGPSNTGRIAAANLSLSGDLFTSYCDADESMVPFKEVVDELRAIGIATVVAAGNNGQVNAIGKPACVSTVVSVGAGQENGNVLAGITNRASILSLIAPGEGITTSTPGGGFARFTGSSLAAAFVSGSWALLKQVIPTASVSTLLSQLQATGAAVPDSTGNTYRRIRLVETALAATGGVVITPGAPQSPHLTIAGSFVAFDWDPPSVGNGPTRYVVTAGTVPGASDIGTFSVGLSESIAAVVGAGTYHVRVRAENLGGAGPPTPDQTFTIQPPQPPAPPLNFASQVAGTTVTLTWQAPPNGGVPTSYVIEAGNASGLANLAVIDTGSPALQLVVPNVPGGRYFLRIRSKNAAGGSVPSNEIIVDVS